MKSSPPPSRSRFASLQWNLSTLLLLTAAVAVWAGFMQYMQRISDLSRQVDIMRQLTADPRKPRDPRQIQVWRVKDYWNDRRAWEVYLPAGEYAVRLGTHEVRPWIPGPVAAESRIGAGLHRVELQRYRDVSRFVVLVDGHRAIDFVELSLRGASVSRDGERGGHAQAPDEPLVLYFAEAFATSGYEASDDAADGVSLWIERVETPR